MVVGRLLYESVPVAVVPPSCLKKYATGNGNASKDAVLIAAVRRLPWLNIQGNDQADAAWLCAAGYEAAGQSLCVMPAVNRAALGKVAWPDLGPTAHFHDAKAV
jgi:Holliday junction resolvasome RuvABC endonuclease subunit